MTPPDLPAFTIWDEKHPVPTHFIIGPPYNAWGEANRRVHGYAATIGETFMYATDNMGLGLRKV